MRQGQLVTFPVFAYDFELPQSLSSSLGFIQLAILLTYFPMLFENLQEIVCDEVRYVWLIIVTLHHLPFASLLTTDGSASE